MTDCLSNRYFRGLTDEELLAWRPTGDYQYRSQNTSRANREYRRRAAAAGFTDVYSWMLSVKMREAA